MWLSGKCLNMPGYKVKLGVQLKLDRAGILSAVRCSLKLASLCPQLYPGSCGKAGNSLQTLRIVRASKEIASDC